MCWSQLDQQKDLYDKKSVIMCGQTQPLFLKIMCGQTQLLFLKVLQPETTSALEWTSIIKRLSDSIQTLIDCAFDRQKYWNLLTNSTTKTDANQSHRHQALFYIKYRMMTHHFQLNLFILNTPGNQFSTLNLNPGTITSLVGGCVTMCSGLESEPGYY